jgi:hypothetical protein
VLGLLVHRVFQFQLNSAAWGYFRKLTLTTVVAVGTAGFLFLITRDISPELHALLSGGFGTDRLFRHGQLFQVLEEIVTWRWITMKLCA